MTVITRNLLLATLTTIAAHSAHAQSPYLPSPGKHDFQFIFTNQKAKDFKPGSMSAQLPADLKQDNFKFNYSYGFNDDLAFDVELGYGKSKFIVIPGLAPNGGLSGTTDSRLGLRYRLFDDQAADPITVTLGLAAIIKGSYDTGALPAIGDGAGGIEYALSIGKSFTQSVAGFATAGIRDRTKSVPSETFYRFGLNVNPTANIGLTIAHEEIKSSGTLDIGGPGFSPSRFPEVKEEYGLTSAGVNVALGNGLTLGVLGGKKRGQRNTIESKVFGLTLGFTY